MSPEQARGDKLVDNRADVYALGAILYELVSLKRPHPGDSQNAILHHIATQPPVSLASIQPELPAELVEVVGRAVSSDPGGRPPTVEALGDALAAFARREVWPAPPSDSAGLRVGELSSTMLADGDAARGTPAVPTVDDRAVPPAVPSAGGQVPVSVTPPPPRKRRVWIGAGVAVALVVLGAALGGLRHVGTPAVPASAPLRLEAAASPSPEDRLLNGLPSPGAAHALPSAAAAPPPPSDTEPKDRADHSAAPDRATSADIRPGMSGHLGTKPAGHPSAHAARKSVSTIEVANPAPAPIRAEKTGAMPPTFDPANPYQ
jgi:hypothetical protein